MKANELRIGNLILCRNETDRVCGIDEKINGDAIICSDKYGVGESDIKPIPLTEEWLLKFGFESWNCKGVYWIFEKVIYKKLDIEQKMIISSSGTCCIEEQEDHREVEVQKFIIRPDIQYVHQLQNLYFALTGEELEIK